MKLKEIIGDLSVANHLLKGGPRTRPEGMGEGVVTLCKVRRITVKKACERMGVARSTYYYERRPRPPARPDPDVEAAIKQLAEERPSFGYRRMTAMVRRRLGKAVNHKKIHRIMRDENLLLHPWFQPRVRVPKQPRRLITEAPDVAYQMDMKYIWCGQHDGWVYLQSAVACCTSEWLAYQFGKRCGSREANQVLDSIVQKRFPQTCLAPGTRLRVDNGPSYRADAFIAHAEELGFKVEHIQVRTPEQNGVVESFHSALDRDYLNHLVFASLAEAEVFIAKAFHDYNHVKPKSRLGWLAPAEYRATLLPKISQR